MYCIHTHTHTHTHTALQLRLKQIAQVELCTHRWCFAAVAHLVKVILHDCEDVSHAMTCSQACCGSPVALSGKIFVSQHDALGLPAACELVLLDCLQHLLVAEPRMTSACNAEQAHSDIALSLYQLFLRRMNACLSAAVLYMLSGV